jgi:signal transduction histidine kinase
MFGPRPVCDLDGSYLAVESYHNCGACFLLAIFHSRRSQLEISTSTNSLELKRMFVRYVSHEIRTPLNTVATGLTLILSLKDKISTCTDPRTKNILQNIFSMTDDCKESCDVAVDILNELLLYEKLEGGILSLEKTIEPGRDVIHDAIQIFNIQARGCGIRMVITYDDLDGIMLEVDKPKISQVLRNLVSNAIKFSPSGSDVTVHTSVTKDTSNSDQNDGRSMFNLRISVEDSGAG